MLAGAVAGVAAALGHTPFGLWPVALLGFAALAYLVSTCDRPTRVAWLGGAGYFGASLQWIVEPFLIDVATHGWMAPFALILSAFGFGLFWAIAGWLSVRLGGNRAIGWAVCLAAMELTRGYIFTGFPWALPSYVWVNTPVLSVAGYVGPYGLTALTLIALSLPFAFHRRTPGLIAGGLLLAALWGAGLERRGIADGAPDGTIRLVQPNAPQDEKWSPERAQFFVERQIGYTAEPKDGVDLIVWPETSIPYRLDGAEPVLTAIAEAAEGVPVVAGINRTDGENWYNSLILIEEDGQVDQTFDKTHLVPFGEYIPFRIEFLRAMAAFSSFGFSAGDGARGIDTPLGLGWALICYEAIFPRHAMSDGTRPRYLLQITNDAWFGNFSGPYQHLDQARFRAVEQGLPLVRAANTGISAVIDAEGRIVASLPLGEAGYLDAGLPRATAEIPLYARTGDLPFVVFILVTLAALAFRRAQTGIANGHPVE